MPPARLGLLLARILFVGGSISYMPAAHEAHQSDPPWAQAFEQLAVLSAHARLVASAGLTLDSSASA